MGKVPCRLPAILRHPVAGRKTVFCLFSIFLGISTNDNGSRSRKNVSRCRYLAANYMLEFDPHPGIGRILDHDQLAVLDLVDTGRHGVNQPFVMGGHQDRPLELTERIL